MIKIKECQIGTLKPETLLCQPGLLGQLKNNFRYTGTVVSGHKIQNWGCFSFLEQNNISCTIRIINIEVGKLQ